MFSKNTHKLIAASWLNVWGLMLCDPQTGQQRRLATTCMRKSDYIGQTAPRSCTATSQMNIWSKPNVLNIFKKPRVRKDFSSTLQWAISLYDFRGRKKLRKTYD